MTERFQIELLKAIQGFKESLDGLNQTNKSLLLLLQERKPIEEEKPKKKKKVDE